MIEGDVETGSVMAGQSVGLVTAEQPVAGDHRGAGVSGRRSPAAPEPALVREQLSRRTRLGVFGDGPAPAAGPAARNAGAQRGAPRRTRPPGRRRAARGGLFGLRDAARRYPGTGRHRGAEAGSGGPDPAARRGGDRRPVRRDGEGDEPARRAEPPGLRLPLRNRRGAIRIPACRPGSPGGPDVRRARDAET